MAILEASLGGRGVEVDRTGRGSRGRKEKDECEWQLEQKDGRASVSDKLSRQRGQHDHRGHGASSGGWQCGCRSPARAGPILGPP
eukprot:4915757-Pyramimonas_sp.AAC.1